MKPLARNPYVNRIVLCSLALMAYCGALGLCAVLQRHQVASTADNVRKQEIDIAKTERMLAETTAEISAASQPEALMKRSTAMGLGLGMPRETQVIRSSRASLARMAMKQGGGMFAFSLGIPPDKENTHSLTDATLQQ